MKSKIQTLIQGLRPLDISELVLLVLTAVIIPFDWFVATRVLMLLILNTIAKLIVNCFAPSSQHPDSKGQQADLNGQQADLNGQQAEYKGQPSDQKNQHIDSKEYSSNYRHRVPLARWAKWALWGLLAYYGLYLISLLYTSNLETAQNYLIRKLPFVGFALFALVSDTSYFTQRHLRLVLYSFSASLVVKFWIRFFVMLVTTGSIKFGSNFDPLHHTYMAMYILMALVFLYSELFRFRKEMSRNVVIIIAIAMVILLADLIFVMSRTGVAGIIVVGVAVIIHQIFTTRRFKTAIITLSVAAICAVGIYAILPESGRRLTQTVSEIGSGDKSDIRFYIMGSAVEVIKDNLPWGVGIGDRTDTLMEYYKTTGNEGAIKAAYNPHNIYLDSLLTIGIPGLLLLLSLLGLFYFIAFKKKDIAMLGWIFSVSFSGLFEAVFDRQMGIMYFAFFYALFCLTREDASPSEIPMRQTRTQVGYNPDAC